MINQYKPLSQSKLTCRIIGRAVESILFAADDTRVAHTAEVNVVLVAVVLTKELVENLGAAVDGLWLEDAVVWGVVLLVVVTTKDSDGRGDEELAAVVFGDVHGVFGSNDVNVKG